MLIMALVVALVVPEHLSTFYPPEKVQETVQEIAEEAAVEVARDAAEVEAASKETEVVVGKTPNMSESTLTSFSTFSQSFTQRIMCLNQLQSATTSRSTLNSQKKRSVRERQGQNCVFIRAKIRVWNVQNKKDPSVFLKIQKKNFRFQAKSRRGLGPKPFRGAGDLMVFYD